MSLRGIILITARSIYTFDTFHQVMRISRDESALHVTDYVTGLRNGEWYRVTRRPSSPRYDYDTDSFGRVTFSYENDEGESARVTTSSVQSYETLGTEGEYNDTFWQPHVEAQKVRTFVASEIKTNLYPLIAEKDGASLLYPHDRYDLACMVQVEFNYDCYHDAQEVVDECVRKYGAITVAFKASENDEALDALREKLSSS